MTRLQAIDIHGFRGVPGNLSISLNGQSLAIYAENAVGKSSIADAIEWFYTDRVAHLWKENCKESALRSALLPENEDASASLHFTESRLDCTKSLSSALASEYSNSSIDFQDHLLSVQRRHERITLRNVDLWTFVLSTKTEKRQEIAQLIGYESLDTFKEVIGRTQTRLDGTPDYVAAKRNIPEYQKEIFKIAKTVLANREELYRIARRMAEEVGVSVAISDDESYTSAVSEIRNRIEGKEKAALKLGLTACRDLSQQLRLKAKETASIYARFSILYQDLIRSEQDIRQIRLETLLALGENAIKQRLTEIDTCPLCLQPKPWATLREEITLRVAKLRESKKKADAAALEKGRILAAVSETVTVARELYKSAAKVGLEQDVLDAIKQYGSTLVSLDHSIKTNFETYKEITANLGPDTNLITETIDTSSAKLKRQIDALDLSKEEQKLFEVARDMENLRVSYEKYQASVDTAGKFDRQIRTIAAIAQSFAREHTRALQDVLDILSNDISRFYLAMHPNEDVEDVKLIVLEEGIEFEYAFHGKRVYPPLKYLSESHLNSLGIAAFLASAKRFNKVTQFLVLDDIVTSFDSNHRLRLVQLLQTELGDCQILILTHQPFWFQIVKKQMLPQGWLAAELELTAAGKLQFKGSSGSFKDEIVQKKTDGSLSANDLRTCLGRILKDVCSALEVKVAFRYNNENERRMPGELISELRSTLKKKSAGTLADPIFSSLETCNLITTTGSHDSGPVLSSGDIAVASEYVLKLDELFSCSKCREYVSVERYVSHEGKVFCACGSVHLDWKQ
jgi:hypothetical protein